MQRYYFYFTFVLLECPFSNEVYEVRPFFIFRFLHYYTYAQRVIGAARTSAYYAIAPFIGVVLSMLILGERPNWIFFVALAIMLVGTRIASVRGEK